AKAVLNIVQSPTVAEENALKTAQVALSADTNRYNLDLENAVLNPASTTPQVVPGTGYNPQLAYQINGGAFVKDDNWQTGTASNITFDLPPSPASSTFQLYVEGYINGVLNDVPGSSQTVGSIGLCFPSTTPTTQNVTIGGQVDKESTTGVITL